MTLLSKTVRLLICIAIAFACACTSNPPLAGATSETTNGFTATVENDKGLPVANAKIRMRPADYIADTTSAAGVVNSSRIVDTFTNSHGLFKINKVDTGNFIIEIQGNNEAAAAIRVTSKKDTLVQCSVVVVKPAAQFKGNIDRSSLPKNVPVYVQILGLEKSILIPATQDTFTIPAIPAGSFSLRFVPANAKDTPLVIPPVSFTAGTTTLPQNVKFGPFADWLYSAEIILNTSSTGAQTSTTLYNFPMLVRLSSSNFNFSLAKASGADLRFAKADGTFLPFEIERFDSVNQVAEIWLKADTVKANSSSQSYFLHYGNVNAVAISNPQSVFDTANGFQGVYHLGENGGSDADDATSNTYTATSNNMTTANSVAGAIGKARSFDGISTYLEMQNSTSGKLNFVENSNYSVSAWVNLDTLTAKGAAIAAKGYQQYGLAVHLDNKFDFYQYNSLRFWEGSRATASTKTWVYLTGVRQGTRQSLYINGTYAAGIIDTTKESTTARTQAFNVTIGKFYNAFDNDQRYFKGKIDEVRFENVALSADWIKLCYLNQQANDKLVTVKK